MDYIIEDSVEDYSPEGYNQNTLTGAVEPRNDKEPDTNYYYYY